MLPISLSDSVHDEVRKRIAREWIDDLLIAGIDSGEPTPLTDGNWESLRQNLETRLEASHAGWSAQRVPEAHG